MIAFISDFDRIIMLLIRGVPISTFWLIPFLNTGSQIQNINIIITFSETESKGKKCTTALQIRAKSFLDYLNLFKYFYILCFLTKQQFFICPHNLL